MRLLTKTGRYFFGFSVIAFFLISITLFFTLNFMLDEELDENLVHTRAMIQDDLESMGSLPGSFSLADKIIDVESSKDLTPVETFRDTLRWDEMEQEFEPFRQYQYSVSIDGKNYQVTLNQSKIENRNLLISILLPILTLMALFLLAFNWFNRFISQRIWKPFFSIVDQIQKFSFSINKPYQAITSDIDEFVELDASFSKMSKRVIQDFQSLKQFTENASHEIQTPLAIIQSQIELLLQSRQIGKEESHHIHQIQVAASRLSKLNQSLVLLTRIENNQFEPAEILRLDEAILKKIEDLEPLITSKEIEIKTDLQPVSLMTNVILMDVLITNLVINAIKHNQDQGQIVIRLVRDHLTFLNTGDRLTIDAKALFGRFSKAESASKSIGLGLAIVKKICDKYHWNIDYTNEGNWHKVVIEFTR
jgi:signal transduction histidine kinase